ncbi:MAG: hypothetical protein ACTSRZ_10550 [Promethearchaeota archaeon]
MINAISLLSISSIFLTIYIVCVVIYNAYINFLDAILTLNLYMAFFLTAIYLAIKKELSIKAFILHILIAIFFAIYLFILTIFDLYSIKNCWYFLYILILIIFILLVISIAYSIVSSILLIPLYRRKIKHKHSTTVATVATEVDNLPPKDNNFLIGQNKGHSKLNEKIFNRIPKKLKISRGLLKKILIGMWLLVILTSLFSIPVYPIEIKPKNYQIKIAFWGNYYYNNADVWTKLNNYNTTLYLFSPPKINNVDQKTEFINLMQYRKTKYPNVTMFIVVYPSYGVFSWDGVADEITNYAKLLIQTITENNLTNVIGVVFDIEEPLKDRFMEGIDTTPNLTRHEHSIQIWNEFIQWKNNYAPNIMISFVNYVDSVVDPLDNDFDTTIVKKYNFLDINECEEYAAMVYRCYYSGKKPYGSYPESDIIAKYLDKGHYFIYSNALTFCRSMEKLFGSNDKVNIYLGITNCSCYGGEVNQYYANFKYEGKGFDSLVKDILILKHFRVPKVTIFLLNTAMEKGYAMGGFFESYGLEALDKLYNLVNGENSQNTFKIYYKPKINYYINYGSLDLFFHDCFLELNSYGGCLFIISTIIVFSLIQYIYWYYSKNLKKKSLGKRKDYSLS